MNKKIQKGQYGYRSVRRRFQLTIILIGAVCILAQLLARNYTDSQEVKNILTVMAVLSVLPVANVASPFLAALPYKTTEAAFYQQVRPFEADLDILYDLIITSKEQIMPMDAVVVHPLGIYAYCSKEKLDIKKAENYLNGALRSYHLHASVFTEERGFIKRLESLKSVQKEEDYNYQAAEQLLKSMSM